ncbi:bacillithiol biosynthesis deacetylase BshB2 [Paenibacillus nasutitermitis]|uniref:Bacillithiol biosynthesis deacetylase BshB2 n=1 Tax=Paenibacillus nasutitermitis TaxID=1652958 RepID=A0A916YJU3_9BACL|nr:bacillithiol biosynthesis deacetylase BshB2 [Paenibacillus nasutitermitis]GGD46539.1 bacillithiol biosynthesis deacetylase BshB2 [Paenibacillus nasutitermitis]
MSRQILIILPHPDDEAFGVAGTAAMQLHNGDKVTYACLTLGEMGRNMGIPPFANRVTLPAIRRQELVASCQAIGISDLRMLGFHDKMIEFEDQEALDQSIGALLKELQPALVLTFYPGYSVHPDHDACGAAVVRTIRRLPADERPVVQAMAFSKNSLDVLGEPDIIQNVIPFLKQKMASIEAHRSQFQAAELVGSEPLTDSEIEVRFGTERFWTYKFEQ